jgi:AraC-like DNA-binding protein
LHTLIHNDCQMGQFLLRKENSPELQSFTHIEEFALKKNNSIRLNSFNEAYSQHLRFYYIVDGKFDWLINDETYTLYPTDLAVILPSQELQAQKGYLEIGALYCLTLHFQVHDIVDRKQTQSWSTISPQELVSIKKSLLQNHTPVISRLSEAGVIFPLLRNELCNQEVGYLTRVNQLLDELLIIITRKLTQQNISQRDFPKAFLKLEEALRKDLSHHWTVEEMSALVGLGTTAFSDRVKSFTGFSPMNYLINIRISEAIKLLKRPDPNVTSIALDTGFYSSQHFSTTFKKLTGYTPSQFRKDNIHKI